jgi:hypothetical protein
VVRSSTVSQRTIQEMRPDLFRPTISLIFQRWTSLSSNSSHCYHDLCFSGPVPRTVQPDGRPVEQGEAHGGGEEKHPGPSS